MKFFVAFLLNFLRLHEVYHEKRQKFQMKIQNTIQDISKTLLLFPNAIHSVTTSGNQLTLMLTWYAGCYCYTVGKINNFSDMKEN